MQEIKQEKSQIKRNISLYLHKKGVSDYEFYKKSGITRGILSQPNGISEDNISRFLAYAPDVNVVWLLTGEQTVLEYECERYVVPAFNGADFLIPVKGNSMNPTYLSGDIVACQRVPMAGLFFQWNKPYVLDTAQGAIIKRIKPGSDKQHVLIVSDNKDYDPFELPCEDIYAVALVIGIIRLE